jgi:hypothetical protein
MAEIRTVHIWMLDGRSLCDRRAHPSGHFPDEESREAAVAEAEAAPVCGACLLLAGRVRRESAAILLHNPTVYPERASEAWESLRETRWNSYFHLDAFKDAADHVDEHTKYDAVTKAVDPATVVELLEGWEQELAATGSPRDRLGGKGPSIVS